MRFILVYVVEMQKAIAHIGVGLRLDYVLMECVLYSFGCLKCTIRAWITYGLQITKHDNHKHVNMTKHTSMNDMLCET